MLQEKISITTKAVRDNTQIVKIIGDKIIVISKCGTRKVGSYEFDLSEWEKLENSFGNPNWNKKEYINNLNKQSIPNNYYGENENSPFISRIEDAQRYVIDKAYKQLKSKLATH